MGAWGYDSTETWSMETCGYDSTETWSITVQDIGYGDMGYDSIGEWGPTCWNPIRNLFMVFSILETRR